MPCKATMLVDTNTRPIPVLGWREGTGFNGEIETADSSTAAYITGLKGEEVYRLAFFLSSDLADGISENCYVRPGGVVTVAPVTTDSMLHPASKDPYLDVKLDADQQSIGVLASGSVALTVKWVRLT